MPPDQHRSTICDDITCRGTGAVWDDVEWAPDDSHLAFVSTSRDHKQEWFRVADATTGEVREVMGETVAKFYESGDNMVNWHYLPKSNEVLWFSERDNWGNLYLYDLTTGQLKNQITHGDGNVTQVLRVDETTRTIYFIGVGKEPGRDPYFQHLYSIHFDGTGQKLLTPENADHIVKLSGDGRYFVDSYSTPIEPQTTVVRDSDGKLVMDVAKQDISKLVAYGWKPSDPDHRQGARRQDRSLRHDVHAHPPGSEEEISDRQPRIPWPPGRLMRPSHLRGRALVTTSLSPSSASSSSASTAWAPTSAPRAFTRPTTAISATTPFPTRSLG